MKTHLTAISVGVLLLIGRLNPALSAEIEGHFYPDKVIAGSTELQITGVALFRYWGFKAYTGAFYMETDAIGEGPLADRAKRLELVYFRSIKGEDFGKAVDKILGENLEPEILEGLRSKIDYHKGLYRDAEPGDRYSLTYVPGQGTELGFNGKPLGTVPGAGFAEAMFSIWFGKNPLNLNFKQEILGRNT